MPLCVEEYVSGNYICKPHDKIPAMTHAEQIASQLHVKPSQVTAVIHLLDEDNTVPFIARYRKEMTGSLDDEQIRIIADELIRLRALDERRAVEKVDTILENLGKVGMVIASQVEEAMLGKRKGLDTSLIEDDYCHESLPMGYFSDPQKPCTYAPAVVTKYQKRISNPLLDGIDIHIEVT